MSEGTAHKLRAIVIQFALDTVEAGAELAHHVAELSARPADLEPHERLAEMRRIVHKTKGTCGFFGLLELEGVCHAGEDLLDAAITGQRRLDRSFCRAMADVAGALKRTGQSLYAGGEAYDRQVAALGYRMLTHSGTAAGLMPVVRHMVSDVAARCDKRVRLHFDGEDTPVPPILARALETPLLHLVRNAVDHGIEPPAERVRMGKEPTGVVSVQASAAAGELCLELSDDGAGIDVDAVRASAAESGVVHASNDDDAAALALVFTGGVSTAPRVTRVSGRGVGLELVRREVESIGGTVSVASRPGRGTTFTLRLPTGRRRRSA